MKESALSKAIRSAFAARGARCIKYHGGPYGEAGIPDLIVCYRGRFVFVETKRCGEKPTPIQLQRIAELRAFGATGGPADAVDIALLFLDVVDQDIQHLEDIDFTLRELAT